MDPTTTLLFLDFLVFDLSSLCVTLASEEFLNMGRYSSLRYLAIWEGDEGCTYMPLCILDLASCAVVFEDCLFCVSSKIL